MGARVRHVWPGPVDDTTNQLVGRKSDQCSECGPHRASDASEVVPGAADPPTGEQGSGEQHNAVLGVDPEEAVRPTGANLQAIDPVIQTTIHAASVAGDGPGSEPGRPRRLGRCHGRYGRRHRRPSCPLKRLACLAVAGAVLATVFTGCGHRTNRTTALPLRLLNDVRLPGDTSRFDYQDVDTGRRRLFIAHLGASRVEVFDLDRLQVVGSITGMSQVHGVRVAPTIGRLYASATGTNQVVTIDEDTLTEIARTPTGNYPDGIAIDLTHQRAFISNENGGTETVVDALTGAPVGSVDLGGEAGNVAVDPSTGRVLVDVQTRDDIAAIDPHTLVVTARTHLSGCNHDHGLLVDAPARLAFVACDANSRLLVIDLDTMSQLAGFSVGDRPDVLAFDAGLSRLYVASESGTVSVFSLVGRSLHLLGQQHLAGHAHSVAVDPATHHVFFPLQSVHGHPVLRVMAPT